MMNPDLIDVDLRYAPPTDDIEPGVEPSDPVYGMPLDHPSESVRLYAYDSWCPTLEDQQTYMGMYHQATAYIPRFRYETRPSCTMVLAAYIRVTLYRIAFSSASITPPPTAFNASWDADGLFFDPARITVWLYRPLFYWACKFGVRTARDHFHNQLLQYYIRHSK